jgi:hypothetical protein
VCALIEINFAVQKKANQDEGCNSEDATKAQTHNSFDIKPIKGLACLHGDGIITELDDRVFPYTGGRFPH